MLKRMGAAVAAMVVLSALCLPVNAGTFTFNFVDMANGPFGESAWNPLVLGPLSITGHKGMATTLAYLDSGHGGLGVCTSLSSGTVNTKYPGSSANLCTDSGDDNVTVDEFLRLIFSQDVVITGLVFNNNHDGDGSLLGDMISLGGTAYTFLAGDAIGGGDWAYGGSGISVAAGASFDLAHVDEQFYLSSITFQTVPEPGSLALLGLGVFGLGLARRRRNIG